MVAVRMKMISILLGMIVISVLISLTITQRTIAESIDPEDVRAIGYEFLLDNGEITGTKAEASYLHVWNNKDDYFFNISSGIQLSNHFGEYWTRNIFCAGYKDNQQDWHYDCNDELPFTWSIESDNLTYINITGYRDKTIGTKEVRLALGYSLGVNDTNLTIIPYVKNIGTGNINNDLGFAWRIKDIQVDMEYYNNYYLLDGTLYNPRGFMNYSNTSMDETKFLAFNSNTSEYLWLKWNENLNYRFEVKNVSNQLNAPATLLINDGTLAAGQEKSTKMYWIDAEVVVGLTEDATDEGGMSPVGVFVNHTTGYTIFAADTGAGDLVFKKSNDSGVTWGDEIELSTAGQFFSSAIWYDQWTPGDEGDKIHILSGNVADDNVYYFNITIGNDAKSAGTIVYDGGSLVANDAPAAITKSTTGRIYAGGQDTGGTQLHYSEDNGSTWTEITPAWFDDDDDYFQLMPLSDGDILVIYVDTTADAMSYGLYNEGLEDWEVDDITISTDLTGAFGQHAQAGATINKKTQDVYVAWNTAWEGTGDYAFLKFSNSTRTWTGLTNISALDDSRQVNMISDDNNGDLYVIYSDGAGSLADVFWRKSTDDGVSWGSPVQLSSTQGDIDNVKGSMTSDQRMYAFWYDDDDDLMYGNTIVNITPIVNWSVSELDLGDNPIPDGNLTGITNVTTFWTHTDVTVVCSSGGCGNFSQNWTTRNSTDLTEAIEFTCLNLSTGVFWALFNVSSNEIPEADQINVSCEIWDYGTLSVNITYPTNVTGLEVLGNTTFDLNATINCTGNSGDRCGLVDALARYNASGNPDTAINITNGALPFFIAGFSTTTQITCSNLTNLGDSMTREVSGNSNFGSEIFMSVVSSSSGDQRAWMKFNTTLPSGSTFNSIFNATLNVYYYSHATEDPVGRTHNLYNTSGDWEEGTITWNNQPDSSILQNSTIVGTPPILMSFDVNASVGDALNGSTNISFVIQDSSEGSSPAFAANYRTKENITNGPFLTACYNETVITGVGNPQSTPTTLLAGEHFNVSWTINATGVNGTYIIDVLANSTTYGDNNISDATFNRTICIGECEAEPPAGDSCDTNAWDCTENCNVEALDAGGNIITANGAGVITILGDITNCNNGGDMLKIWDGCEVRVNGNTIC